MIPVFYDERMLARVASFSPSAMKPKAVVDDWLLHHPEAIKIAECGPVSNETLASAHSASYVAGVMGGSIPNGFGTTHRSVALSTRWTVGSMLSAASWAAGRGRGAHNVACSPTSGFHHAGWANSGGYCTFNGLMVTAMTLLAEGAVKRVGILDCDFHEGDGTQDIIDTLLNTGRLPATDMIVHRSAGAARLSTPSEFFRWLYASLSAMASCDLVLYQAGGDMLASDPLGGLLQRYDMIKRDQQVFRHQLMYGFPLVWNLAGGYSRDPSGGISEVLQTHRDTLRACINAAETV